MRLWLAASVAMFLAACGDVDIHANGAGGGADPGGYTLEVRAADNEQIFLVTAPDGHTVAARAADGVSALMDDAAIHALAAEPPAPANADMQQAVSVRAPGLNLSVSGDPDRKGEDGSGRVSINIGGHGIEVNADDGGPGDADGRAHVRITGVPESDARDFIAKADQLSPAVQAQMLAALGLE
jgi:hypothetical protein